nr:ABC transporter permease [Acuticoccus mangrovi]
MRRLLVSIPVLFGVTLIAFAFVRLLPGDPAVTILGERATPAAIERLRTSLGLDRPIWQQYAEYMSNLLQGDLGNSTITAAPVTKELFSRFPATLELSICALLIGVTAGLWLGRAAARRPGGGTDGGLTLLSLLGISIPIFVLGPLLQYVFGVVLDWLPTSGRINPRLFVSTPTGFLLWDTASQGEWGAFRDVVAHLVLPSVTLSMMPMAMVARMTRSSVIEVQREDYVRTARAKGVVPPRIARRHVMRNAWLPVVTVIGLQVGALLAGTVITETVFGWNGVGSLVVNAINQRDYFVVQSAILVFAVIFIVVNLLVDISYALLDPRISYR